MAEPTAATEPAAEASASGAPSPPEIIVPVAPLARRDLRGPILLALALILGGALRFTWNADMEYKGDEQWMFDRAMHVGRDEPWPMLGMQSGVDLKNPGMSVWLFVALGRVIGAHTPLQLDRGVVGLNVLALLLLGLFIWRVVPEDQRELWMWGAALAAVNPMGLVFQRKIWTLSAYPTFSVLFLWAWWRRDRRWGALVWGLIGAELGQIHMSGFFLAFAFFAMTVVASFGRDSRRPRVRWGSWLIGSVLGSISLVPWLQYLASGTDHRRPWSSESIKNLKLFRHAFSDGLGLSLDYSLGGRYDDFLRFPSGWSDFYPPMYLQAVSFTCGSAIVLFALAAAWKHRSAIRQLLTWPRRCSETALALVSALLIFGVLLTLSGAAVQRHYLHVTYPFEVLLFAFLAIRYAPHPRRWLLAIWLAQLGLSVSFLDYIHLNGGAVGGDYGKAYRGN